MSSPEAESFSTLICRQLRDRALSLPETSEGSSCVNRAFRVRNKNFFFLGEKPDHIYAMVKLKDSLLAAEAMEDARVSVGKFGWLTLRFPADGHIDEQVLSDWILESYRNFAPKALVRQLDHESGR